MPASKMRTYITIIALLITPLTHAAYNDTEDDWQCLNEVDGEWNFGRVPNGCDVTPFGTEAYVTENYGTVIFIDSADRSSERRRYMQELNAFIRDAANYYLLTRKPDASAAEQTAWQHAINSVAHQETFWSHYRTATDNRIKMVRGDSGHGHGMMQIDDRWHFVALNQGKGFNLIENIIYALDIYYAEWQNAPDESCLDSATNWRNRARSAYSAYNGGPSQICRWTDPDDLWANNDIGFASKYDNQSWNGYIDDTDHTSAIDVECLAEGGTNCHRTDFSAWDEKLLKIDSGDACIYANQRLHCLDDERNATCLTHVADFDLNLVTQLTTADISGITRSDYNPHQICSDLVQNLHPVGSFIQVLQDIELTAAPGGGKIGDIPANFILQVLDFQIEDKQDHDRFYMVTYNGQTGYIYAGDTADAALWTAISSETPQEQLIPVTGQTIRIVIDSGINLRATPGGTKISAVPQFTELQVQSYVVEENDNKIYYEVDYAGQSGFIYGGHIIEPPTMANWATIVEEDNSQNSSGDSNSGSSSSDSSSGESSSGESSSGGGSTCIYLILMMLCTTVIKSFRNKKEY